MAHKTHAAQIGLRFGNLPCKILNFRRAQISNIWINGPRGDFPRLASFRKNGCRPHETP